MGDDSNALHLLCTIFLLLLYQVHLRSSGIGSRRLGTPALHHSWQALSAQCMLPLHSPSFNNTMLLTEDASFLWAQLLPAQFSHCVHSHQPVLLRCQQLCPKPQQCRKRDPIHNMHPEGPRADGFWPWVKVAQILSSVAHSTSQTIGIITCLKTVIITSGLQELTFLFLPFSFITQGVPARCQAWC